MSVFDFMNAMAAIDMFEEGLEADEKDPDTDELVQENSEDEEDEDDVYFFEDDNNFSDDEESTM